MQLWFARGGEVTIREQLVTQLILGILSGDLTPGQRLPSTRELARRFHLHANTVSAGYRELERQGWLEVRHGSGAYVRQPPPQAAMPPMIALDRLISNLFRSARAMGLPLPSVRARLQQWLLLQPPDHFLLIEPDPELRRIVALEIEQAVKFPVKACGLEDCRREDALQGAIPVALLRKSAMIREMLPNGAELITLNTRSVPASLAKWLPVPSHALVAVASRWPEFLRLARTMLIAAGFHTDALIFRDARKPEWQRGLRQTAAVVCDVLTASGLPRSCQTIPFSLLSAAAIKELQRYQQFISQPLHAL